MIQINLTLTMTTAQVVEMPVTLNNNSPIEDYFNHIWPTCEICYWLLRALQDRPLSGQKGLALFYIEFFNPIIHNEM